MAIELPKETRATAVASIERWFVANLDMRVGNMQAAELLDFFLKELGQRLDIGLQLVECSLCQADPDMRAVSHVIPPFSC